jgi:hypothetical protein
VEENKRKTDQEEKEIVLQDPITASSHPTPSD